VEPEDLRIALNEVGRTTRHQVQRHQWTPELIKDALTGDDTLGLGGNLFGQDFVAHLFAPPSVPLPDNPTPPVAITSTSPEVEVIPFLTPPLATTPLPRHVGDLEADQDDPYPPPPPPPLPDLPPFPPLGEDLQIKLEIISTP
jgi:hypothetical protein